MPMQQWADLFDQPDEFGRQPRPERSKPRRVSLLCGRGQTRARLDAAVIRIMLSLGVRVSFVQKINALCTFRSFWERTPKKETSLMPASPAMRPENRQE